MATSGRENELTDKQRRAVAALLTARNVAQAAEKAGVGERTLARWLAEDPVFRAALLEAEGNAIDAATRRLIGLADGAIVVTAGVMTNTENSAAVRLRAAGLVLENLLRLRELRNVEDRLAALETAIGKQS
jgi:phage terminase small subunit